MARMYNCKCGELHPVGEPCPHKYKYKKDHGTENNKKANKFYSSKEWKSKRKEIIGLDKGLCVRCLLKYGIVTTEHLEVHHIEPLIKYWEKRLQNDNLITLCVNCHRFVDLKNNGKLDFEFKRVEEEFNFEFR